MEEEQLLKTEEKKEENPPITETDQTTVQIDPPVTTEQPPPQPEGESRATMPPEQIKQEIPADYGGPTPLEPKTPEPPDTTCDQLRDRFQALTKDKYAIDTGVTDLEEAYNTFQDDNIQKALDEAKKLQKEVNEEISKVMEQSFGKNCPKP